MSHRRMHIGSGYGCLVCCCRTEAHAAPAGNESPPPVTALSMMASVLPCSDLDRSIAFYTNGLGMTLARRIDMPSGTEAPLMFQGHGRT